MTAERPDDARNSRSTGRYLRTGPKQRIDSMALLTAVQEVRAKVKLSHELAGVVLAATQALP